MISWAAAGALSPPWDAVLARPEVLTALGAMVVAIIGVVTAGFVALSRMLTRRLDQQGEHVAEVKEQVSNSHGTNLRNDMDEIRDLVIAQGEEMREGFRRMDHQFGEVHDRQIQTERRVEGVESRATEEHHRIWQALDKP
jgi:hypothetical protein